MELEVFNPMPPKRFYQSQAQYALRKLLELPADAVKRMVCIGDSTLSQQFVIADAASTIVENGVQSASYLARSLCNNKQMPFFNYEIYNKATNGQTLANFLADNISNANISDIAALNPHVTYSSWLINDVRTNAVADKATAKTMLTQYLMKLRAALPNACHIIRMPNSFLYDAANTFGYFSGATHSAAEVQLRSDRIRDAYREITYPDDCFLWDTQGGKYKVFSEKIANLGQGNLLGDALHPSNACYYILWHFLAAIITGNDDYLNYRITANNIKLNSQKPSKQQIDHAVAISSASPYLHYPRVLEDTGLYNLLFDGLYEGGAANTNIIISNNIDAINAKDYCGIIQAGDVVLQTAVTATTPGSQGEKIEDGYAAWAIPSGNKNESGNNLQWYGLSGSYPLASTSKMPIRIYRKRPNDQKLPADPDFGIVLAASDFSAQTVRLPPIQRAGVALVLFAISKTGPSTGGFAVDIKVNNVSIATVTWASGQTVPTYGGAFVGANTKGYFFNEGDIVEMVIPAGYVGGTFPKIVLSRR